MRLKEPSQVAVVFDSSVLIGIIFEPEGREIGRANEAFESLKTRGNHKLFLSEAIFEETIGRLFREVDLRGFEYLRRLMDSLESLWGQDKAERAKGDKLKAAKVVFPVPNQVKHDEETLKVAIVVKEERYKLVYLVHKNPRDFNLIKGQMQAHYGILTLESSEYIDP